ncbi:MAG: beta-eliminating lyase-related protein [Pseudomonadota bacterium]
MTPPRFELVSDNTTGIAPQILKGLASHASGRALPYGDDTVCTAASEAFDKAFEREVQVRFVTTGTAANALALACLCPPFGAIATHRYGHVYRHECGAVEACNPGCRLLPIGDDPFSNHAKITPKDISPWLAESRQGGVHVCELTAVTLSQPTEAGTLYTLEEIRALTDWAHSEGLKVHMDGARLANAAVALDDTLAEMTWRAGVDILSFGGTKNGCMAAESVVIFNDDLDARLRRHMKRFGHVLSKGRFLGAQWLAYLADETWRTLARQANEKAQELAQGLQDFSLAVPVQSNMLFVEIPPKNAAHMIDQGYLLAERFRDNTYRLVTGFDTTDEMIQDFIRDIKGA